MKTAVIVFPGSNCDADLNKAIEQTIDTNCRGIWHNETLLPSGLDVLFIPGGFSFGDYLRCGAIAAKSPIMEAIINFAARGGYIIGICNGFQILTEAGLLKGALIRNSNLTFICREESLIVENNDMFFSKDFSSGEVISLPIAHHDGNYQAEDQVLKELEDNNQIAFRYKHNPNGSKNNIAGITSSNRRIIGMMPHPERSIDSSFTSSDGKKFFTSIARNFLEN